MFDLVIVDSTVPGGAVNREAMEALLRINRPVRAMVSSGYSSDTMLACNGDHEFVDVIPKPYELTGLTAAVSAALAAKR